VKDVEALGDCAILAVLCHPNFKAPLCEVQELHRAVVSFARGPRGEECRLVYSLLRAVAVTSFDAYLEQVLQPKFWVGTEFFVWVSMLYGVDICVHFFTAEKVPSFQSTADFLRKSIPGFSLIDLASPNSINIFSINTIRWQTVSIVDTTTL
jgi:hypothetical protein